MLFVKSAGRIFTSSESLFQYKYKGTPALSYFSSSAVIAESYLVQSAIKYSISPFSTRDINSLEFKTNLSLTLQVRHQSAVKFKRIFFWLFLSSMTLSEDHFLPRTTFLAE